LNRGLHESHGAGHRDTASSPVIPAKAGGVFSTAKLVIAFQQRSWSSSGLKQERRRSDTAPLFISEG
jgi:hypothetical protein